MTKSVLLSGSAFFFAAVGASAQDSAAPSAQVRDEQLPDELPPDFAENQGTTIVVTGQRNVIGDIPPQTVLDSRDVQATGATDINELLEAIEPQIGSASGRGGERPIMLLDGQRISSFRELRDIPTEAIRNVEIFPEEVALRYGYRADQKVVNFVLWPRFRSTSVLVSGKAVTQGGYAGEAADGTRLMIGDNGRTTINIHAENNGMLTENERDILPGERPAAQSADPQAARSLIGSKSELRGTVTVNRHVGQAAVTGNLELRHNSGRSLIGLGDTALLPLARDTVTDSAHAGGVLSGNAGDWRWSVTANADADRSVTKTDSDSAAGRDRAETTTISADVDAMANGVLFKLPAGDAGVTFRAGASRVWLDSERSDAVTRSSSLGRTVGHAAANLDLPLSRRRSSFASIGNLTLNANARVEQFSDFGTVATLGAGANWSPAKQLTLIGNWSVEEGAPTVHQLGDPLLETPDARIFDFTTGETVLVTAITGGNGELDSDRRGVWKFGGNWKPLDETNLTIRGEYVRSRIDDPISSFPGPTAALEEAFPERFVRNPEGKLVRVDLRPVNYDSARRETVRIGFDFSKHLQSARPSRTAVEAFRSRRAAGRQGTASQTEPAAEAPRGRGFGRFGGRDGGRLQFSLTDTITLVDKVTIRDELKLDFLHGDAAGQSGGRPRHQIEARAGYFNNGLGGRLSANWRSATNVTTATGDDLHFSPVATFDLRLWANLGQRYDLVARHPWLRGTLIRLEATNLFNSKPAVRDAFGAVPLGYQPDLLDPLGRTVSVTIRKLFLPPRSFYRREGAAAGED